MQREVEQRLGDEVAVADGVERVVERAWRSRGRRPSPPDRSAATCRPARRRRAATRRGARRSSSRRSTSRAERPAVGEQVVGEQHRLGPLEVGVAGQVGVARPPRRGRAAPPAGRRRGAATSTQLALAPQPQVGGHLVVAAARRCAAWRRPAPASSVTRRSTAVWMSSSDCGRTRTCRRPSRRSTVSSAASTASRSSSSSSPARARPRDVGARAGDVVAPQPPVERQADGVRHQLVGRAAGEAPVPQRRAGRRGRRLIVAVVRARRGRAGGRPSSSPVVRLGGDAQQRVVAGDRAEQAVERRCGRAPRRRRGRSPGGVRSTTRLAEHGDLGDPLAQHPAQLVDRREPVGLELGDGVHGLAAGHAHLDRAEVLEVARHGRLRGRDALARPSSSTSCGWLVDRVLADQPGDRLLALRPCSSRSSVAHPEQEGEQRRGRRAGGCGPAGTRRLRGPSITSAVDLHAAVGGQAVQEDRVRGGRGHQRVVDREALERLHARRLLGLLAHRHPRVGVHGVGAGDRLGRPVRAARRVAGAEQRRAARARRRRRRSRAGRRSARAAPSSAHDLGRASGRRCCSRRPRPRSGPARAPSALLHRQHVGERLQRVRRGRTAG